MSDVLERKVVDEGKLVFAFEKIIDPDPDLSELGEYGSSLQPFCIDRRAGIFYGASMAQEKIILGKEADGQIWTQAEWEAHQVYEAAYAEYQKAYAAYRERYHPALDAYRLLVSMRNNATVWPDEEQEKLEAQRQKVLAIQAEMPKPPQEEQPNDPDTIWLRDLTDGPNDMVEGLQLDPECIKITWYGPQVLASGLRRSAFDRHDLGYFYPPAENYHPTDQPWDLQAQAEEIKYCLQDYARMEAYNRQEWSSVGLRVELLIEGQEIISTSLWGIESDCEEAEFKEIFADLKAECLTEARKQLAKFEAITEALKTLDAPAQEKTDE